MKPDNQSKELFKGIFILTIAALLTKILSAFYRIPFQNIVGDVGFYIYQQAYPFYGLAVVLATTGFPVVISKLYAEFREKGDVEGGQRFLFQSFFILQIIGTILFLILYVGSEEIARVMNDPSLAILLKVVSIVFLTFPLIAVLRGYFQGKGNMLPTAVSQVAEQAVRVGTILLLAFLFTRAGYSKYLIGAGAMFGSITGAIVSASLLFIYLGMQKKKQKNLSYFKIRNSFYDLKKTSVVLSVQGLAICITGALLIFIQLADSLNLYFLLTENGLEKETAKALKGVYDRGQPLIQLGTVVATSISLTLVPLITAKRMNQNTEFILHKIGLAVKINIVVGLAATTGLWAIIKPTNIMLFKNSLGSDVLGILTTVIILNSLLAVIIAIMQGIGIMMFPALVIFLCLPVKYMLNNLLIPAYGTSGAAIATIITICMAIIVLRIRLLKAIPQKLVDLPFIKSVLIATVIMFLVLKVYIAISGGLYDFFPDERMAAALQAISAVIFGGLIYLVLIIRQSVFNISELMLLPFGSKLLLFLPKHKGRK
ncbi:MULTISPECIES: polysaccharide biosynthesis protein [unclassified Bacillus (in: firmicutes)]|uniref:putative polysaccharide biosynthesis protein n=1 Tax=unclassified Bacillus (in: firmicutes) TaxID=185979 RepID=UPI0008F30E63|nr:MULTISPECIES: polysaccharide biosynthesis protein [unclassified Bacillus (in: firmicutes)]SFB22820.1 Polysaccharide biosynthesis C-terminal domain-containing protein [Bacillus sp. UNCCL13]SFQ91172.1 Polysaccharide biosynthesis C-terminal domain-containing protein [Bacillus sp. cl95]